MNLKVKNMIYCSMFACMIALLAQIKFDLPSLVPITLQTLGIYLVACLQKPKYAFISALVYVLMGAIGLPVFAGFSGGFSALIGPTGGYIFSFPIMAVIISLLLCSKDTLTVKIIAMLVGTFICYLIGTIWFIYVTQSALAASLMMCVIPFIPGDLIKIIVACILAQKLKNIRN